MKKEWNTILTINIQMFSVCMSWNEILLSLLLPAKLGWLLCCAACTTWRCTLIWKWGAAVLLNRSCSQAEESYKLIHSQMIIAGWKSLDFTDCMCPKTGIHAGNNSKSYSGLQFESLHRRPTGISSNNFLPKQEFLGHKSQETAWTSVLRERQKFHIFPYSFLLY